MKRFFIYMIVLSVGLWSMDVVWAQAELAPGVGMKKVGQSTMNFLQVSVLPGASAMGEAYTAYGTGCEGIFFNPAGLPEMDSRFAALVATTQWVVDINYLAGALAWNLGNMGTLGLSFVTVDYGEIIWTGLAESPDDVKGYKEFGTVSNVGAYAFGVSYGRRITNMFSIGGNVRYVGQQLGESYLETGKKKNSESQVAFDMGVKFYPGIKSFRFAMSIRNFGPSIKYEEITAHLPLTFAVGVAMDMMDLIVPGHSQENRLLVSAEFVHPNNYTERVNVGVEYKLMKMLALRGGYQSNTDLAGFSGGIGITPPSVGGAKLEFGYSYSVLEIFDGVNRFSLKVEL
ncbi:MAG: PorV/PorQ family protein [candidate division KSB1 bacterium]|nr:PorV/PorQ family protein [candidate division KSB1 bacterium]